MAASRVGTGNIVGVSTAICMGGPGAIFWMWITAWLGGASAFIESTLAQIYKKKDRDGTCYGGPSYYMQDALGKRWLGIVFAVIIILTYAVGYNMLAAFNLQSSFAAFSFYNKKTSAIIGFAPNAAASADVSHPVKQGLVQLTLFAYTTLIGNYYYCEGCLKFMLKKTPSGTFMTIFRLCATALVFLGTLLTVNLAWDTADMLRALTVIINIPAILVLTKPAIKCFEDYLAQKKAGKNPEYIAKIEDVKVETDF